MSATIKYKGTTLASITTNTSKTLKTSGKYCEGDIVVENVQDGGITPTGNKAITATTSTQTGIDVTNYATVSVAPTPSEIKSVTTNGDVTPSSGKLLSKVTVNVPTGTARSASDLTASGATVTVPAGLYSTQATKSVASGSAGTPTASKGTVSNNSVTVTPSVTNTTGYITGGTKTGTGVTVSASELVSGNKALTPSTTAQTNIDVKNYATASVAAITKELLASLDADFVAENIKKDVDLFGLLGTLDGGGGDPIDGYEFLWGTFTPASVITTSYTIETALPQAYGENWFFVCFRSSSSISSNIRGITCIGHETLKAGYTTYGVFGGYVGGGSTNNNNLSYHGISATVGTTIKFTISCSSTAPLSTNTYIWLFVRKKW